MPRFVPLFVCLFVFWLVIAGSSEAQETTRLRVQPDRLQKAKRAEQQALLKKDAAGLAEAYYLYGRTYIFAGDYRTSQGYFLKSLRLLEPRGDSFELSRLYVRLSENEGRLGRFPDALHYANLSLAVAQRTQLPKALGLAYGVLARAYENKWDQSGPDSRATYAKILFFYHKKGGIYRAMNDTLGIAETSLELGTLLTKVDDSAAIPLLEESLRLTTLLHRNQLRINVMLHLASAYLTFGRAQLAFQTLQEAEKIYTTHKLDEYDTILGLEKEYVRYYQTQGQWEAAFAHLEKQSSLEKNQLMSDREATVARLNVEYETGKKDARLKAQQDQLRLRTENLRTQERLTAATSALFVLAAGMSLVFFRLYRKTRRMSRWNEELVKEQNHRVKNNLQIVSSLLSLQAKRLSDEAARKAVEESQLRVNSMAIIHRRLYDGDKLVSIDLSEFIPELVGDVLNAYGYTNVQTRLDIGPITLAADKAIPLGLILNELTTNACKYAFPYTDMPIFSIQCYQKNNRIKIAVADNGNGWTDARSTHSSKSVAHMLGVSNWGREPVTAPRKVTTQRESFGMQLIRAQTEQLYGTFGFSESQESAGVVFTLEFNA